ncbi:MAG: HTH domain-containing protein, partial [Pseudomonadota bacterium]
MQKLFALLEKLQDGRNRSGQELADNMQLTRGAVWHQVKQLQALGIDIHAVSGKGYRLPGGYEFLNAQEIKTALPHDVAEKISSIDVYQVVDSTNEKLLTESAREDVHGRLVLSEYQTAGRGRRG